MKLIKTSFTIISIMLLLLCIYYPITIKIGNQIIFYLDILFKHEHSANKNIFSYIIGSLLLYLLWNILVLLLFTCGEINYRKNKKGC